MAEIPLDVLSNSCQLKRAEKKCEREFRKLMEGSDSGISKQRCDYLGNVKKRHRVDEEHLIVNLPSSSSNIMICPLAEFCKGSGEVHPVGEMGSRVSKVTVLVQDGIKQHHGFNLSTLYDDLSCGTNLETRCQRLINLAAFCIEGTSESHFCKVLESLDLLSDSYQSDALAICHALLLFTLTTKTLTLNQMMKLEEYIVNLAHSAILTEDMFGNKYIGSGLVYLTGDNYLKAYKLCQKLFAEKCLDIEGIDVLTICCSSLRNLSICKTVLNYRYKAGTLKFILGMTGKATQEIVAENLVDTNEDCTIVSAPSHMVNQCLQILEHMLTVDPDLPCKTLDHEDFSLLHCLTRLLGWCISFLFQREQSENHPVNTNSLSSFHLSTLITILKILSILSFNPDQYDSFTNIKGLMEKVMICILKAYFQSKENRFDVLVLALELMINFFLKNKKTFVLLCLKKFQINHSEEVLSIDALLKILGNSLDKINEIKAKALESKAEETSDSKSSETGENKSNKNSQEADMKRVLAAADEDMELSTIVSFISILLVFFMDTKQSFLEFIRGKLSLEKSTEAITVSKKVLQFASLTGGMPPTGLLLLRHAIKKLSRLHASS